MSARLSDVEALTAIVEPIIDYAGDLPWSESSGPRAQNIARAILASDWLAARLAEAEQAADNPTLLADLRNTRVERDAAEAALADLRARVEALADEWACDDPGCDREGGDFIRAALQPATDEGAGA